MNRKGKEIQSLSTHTIMFSEVSADDFDPELLFKSATIRLISFLFLRGDTLCHIVPQSISSCRHSRTETFTSLWRKQVQRAKANKGGRENWGGEGWRECRWRAVGRGEGTVYRSSFESANHSEGEHQLVRLFPTWGRKNERRGGQVHMKAVEINTSLSPQQ